MLSDFIDYLMENYSATITELSETGGMKHCKKVPGERFIEDDFRMIDLDVLACKLPGSNLSSVDGLYVKEKDDQITFYLIEFKKMDLDNPQDIFSSYYFLDKHRALCKQDCQFSKIYEISRKNLKDRNQVGLELKPLNSLILIHRLFIQYEAYQNSNQSDSDNFLKNYSGDFSENEEILSEFSNIKYQYIIVYDENAGFSPNPYNEGERIRHYFDFLRKLKPYPFTNAFQVNSDEFKSDTLVKIKS